MLLSVRSTHTGGLNYNQTLKSISILISYWSTRQISCLNSMTIAFASLERKMSDVGSRIIDIGQQRTDSLKYTR
ncbi:hypothetical protein BOTCAL_0746g00010 [Botryotinia calthae]|uniref:Uncharacterized protein n=1 Tax=Botryotinia calthae TaxID=38488 RepID=A0A4Y8CJ55_9HELO|nr:hypothetical protein BOTCAL_0746g00010 [Botryotinia calthae]